MRKLIERPVFWIAVIIACAVLVGMLGACGGPNDAQPVVCATYQAPDGTWMEEDNEPINDDDPCDLELDLDPYHVKSPKPKPAPVKTPQQPKPRPSTKR